MLRVHGRWLLPLSGRAIWARMALGLPSGARQVCCPVERQHGFEQSKVSPHPLILNTGSPASQNAHPPPLAPQHGIFGLAQGQAEHCAQRPRRGVGRSRVARLAASRDPRLGFPGCERRVGEPSGGESSGQAVALTHGVIWCQVCHLVPLPRGVVTLGSVALERHDQDLWEHGQVAWCCRSTPGERQPRVSATRSRG